MLLTELQTYSLTHLANKPFSSASSGDNSFSFITEKGLDILELSPDPKSVSPSLSCRRYVIQSSDNLPTANLYIKPNDLLPHLDREDVYRLISDTTAAPRLARTLTPTPAPRSACWSPVGILHNHRCVFAVLTDVGAVSLYVLCHGQYTEKIDISSLWLQVCKAEWPPSVGGSRAKFKELQTQANMVKITAICWLNKLVDGSGLLATSSKNGAVILWKVKTDDATALGLKVDLITQFKSDLAPTTMLYWTSLTQDKSLLVLANAEGCVQCFTLNPEYTIVTTNSIWEEADQIPVTHLTSWSRGEGLLLIVVKGPFVITFHVTNDGEKVSHAVFRCCDISINGLFRLSADDFLVVTRSGRFSRLSVSSTADTKLTLKADTVESYINLSHMGCYGITMSENNVICFILLSVNQSYDHLRLREPTQVVICSINGLLDPKTVLHKSPKPVSQMWDCLELVRVQILQKTLVSELSYPRSVLDNMTVDQLTSTLWWITFASAVEERESEHKALLSLRCEVEMLLASCHFFKHTALLLSCDQLSPFQQQSLGVMRKWLLQLQNLSDEFYTTLITCKTLLEQLKALEDKFPADELCAICGSLISELPETFVSECSNGHRLPRCSLSLVQCCQLPYYVCCQCGALAHPLAVEEFGVSCNLCQGILRIDENVD